MFALKDIQESLYDTFNAEAEEDRDIINREIRKQYYELCDDSTGTSWAHLRDTVQFVYSADDDGMWLPSDVAGVDCVSDGTSIWNKSSMSSAIDKGSSEKKWFFSETCFTPLLSGKGLEINDGDTTFSGASGITEAMVGKYIRIGGQPAVYKLASTTTLETPYRGPKQVSATFEVRPAGTRKIKLLAGYGETDTTEATIYVWRFPPQLYQPDQLVMLPTPSILENAVKIKRYAISGEKELKNGAQKDQYGAKGRYQGDLTRAISANPEFIPPVLPRNAAGGNAGWGARP